MGSYLHILTLVTIGVILLCFGFSFLARQLASIRLGLRYKPGHKRRHKNGIPGDPQVCPVCSALLNKGELVSSHAFPSLTGGKDRLMHIQGCYYCLRGYSSRRCCPVCGAYLRTDEFLIARMFERPHRRNHVHVLGCSRCKKVKK